MSTLVSPLTSASASESTQPRELTHWIAGKPVAGASGRFGDVFHPASGRVQSRVPLATDAEVDAAV
jgi:malonate-semialdehyde dehydrogenase (acetylating) / methylmalonate-semialdehyde dehydrogenase